MMRFTCYAGNGMIQSRKSIKFLNCSNARKYNTPFLFSNATKTARKNIYNRRYLEVHALPQKQDKTLGIWLGSVGIAVFGMICVGGVTRLTRSGLSMVDWKLQGRPLPKTKDDWEIEFDKYKLFPEFKRRNQSMTLEEFKNIYFLEWLHRMWGRGLGLIYGLPCLFFLATRKQTSTRLKLLGLLALGGSQGLVGWWMVKSGLDENMPKHKDPRVSPYRLAAHLTTAMVLYSGLVWMSLSQFRPRKVPKLPNTMLKPLSIFGLVLIGTTFVSGAFVAGNDAGCAYNDWPLYAGDLIPDEARPFFKGKSKLTELFENTGVVQFNHRNLAYLSVITSGLIFALTRRKRLMKLNIDEKLAKKIQLAGTFVGGMAVCQATLGISTLMLVVPTSLASLHQAGAITLWTTLLHLLHCLRYTK